MTYTADFTTQEPARAEVEALPGLTLLEFGAPWCPHCQAVQPLLEKLIPAGVRHLKIEDGKGRPLGRSYGVKLWPNLIFLRDGQIQQQLARPDQISLEAAFQSFSKS
jgi:thioredoxin 1